MTCAVSDTEWSHCRMTRRRSGAVDQPDQFAFRIGVMRRQVLARSTRASMSRFLLRSRGTASPRRRQGGKRQRDAGHVRLTAGFHSPRPRSFPAVQSCAETATRYAHPVNTHEHDIRQRPRGVESVATIKSLELGLVMTRCDLGAAVRCRHPMHVLARGTDGIEKEPPRHSDVAQRILGRHEAVVADEPMGALPRHPAAARVRCKQSVERLGGGATGQTNGDRPGVSPIRARRRRAAVSANASASPLTTSCGLRAGTLFPGFNRSPSASIAREEMIRLRRTFTAGLVGR